MELETASKTGRELTEGDSLFAGSEGYPFKITAIRADGRYHLRVDLADEWSSLGAPTDVQIGRATRYPVISAQEARS